ncbi:hypothetical protein E2P81_ATG11925 [Venturia nashicola]|nr:hypothetical protein E2P81_ATG11925 [Venturia nashicola]
MADTQEYYGRYTRVQPVSASRAASQYKHEEQRHGAQFRQSHLERLRFLASGRCRLPSGKGAQLSTSCNTYSICSALRDMSYQAERCWCRGRMQWWWDGDGRPEMPEAVTWPVRGLQWFGKPLDIKDPIDISCNVWSSPVISKGLHWQKVTAEMLVPCSEQLATNYASDWKAMIHNHCS